MSILHTTLITLLSGLIVITFVAFLEKLTYKNKSVLSILLNRNKAVYWGVILLIFMIPVIFSLIFDWASIDEFGLLYLRELSFSVVIVASFIVTVNLVGILSRMWRKIFAGAGRSILQLMIVVQGHYKNDHLLKNLLLKLAKLSLNDRSIKIFRKYLQDPKYAGLCFRSLAENNPETAIELSHYILLHNWENEVEEILSIYKELIAKSYSNDSWLKKLLSELGELRANKKSVSIFAKYIKYPQFAETCFRALCKYDIEVAIRSSDFIFLHYSDDETFPAIVLYREMIDLMPLEKSWDFIRQIFISDRLNDIQKEDFGNLIQSGELGIKIDWVMTIEHWVSANAQFNLYRMNKSDKELYFPDHEAPHKMIEIFGDMLFAESSIMLRDKPSDWVIDDEVLITVLVD